MLMQIGDKSRWWNRKVPIGRISLIVLIVVVAASISPYFAEALRNVFWGISHRWTASYRGRSLKIPLMWRQEDSPNGQKTIALQRARLGQLFAFEMITIHDDTASPQDPNRAIQNLRVLEQRIGNVDTGVFVSKDKDVAEHYACLSSRHPRFNTLRIDCVSKDGKWTAVLDGYGSNIVEFQTVLNNLSAMGDLLPW
jgi:hypothetical protein